MRHLAVFAFILFMHGCASLPPAPPIRPKSDAELTANANSASQALALATPFHGALVIHGVVASIEPDSARTNAVWLRIGERANNGVPGAVIIVVRLGSGVPVAMRANNQESLTTVDALEPGQRVEVKIAGPVKTTLPAQADAAQVTILE